MGRRHDLDTTSTLDRRVALAVTWREDVYSRVLMPVTYRTLLFQSPPGEDGTDTAVEGLEIFVVREDGDDEAPDGSGRKGWWVPAPKPEGVSEGGSILVNGESSELGRVRVSMRNSYSCRGDARGVAVSGVVVSRCRGVVVSRCRGVAVSWSCPCSQ
jgi:hypothetical protein